MDKVEGDLRVAQSMQQELFRQERVRLAEKQNEAANKALEQSRIDQRRSDYEAEQQEARRKAREFNLQEEYRLLAQTQRVNAAEAHYKKGTDFYLNGAGRIDAEREKRENDRLARDLKMNNALYDVYHKTRDDARARQQQNVQNGLNLQSSTMAKRRLIDNQMRQMELRKVEELGRKGDTAEQEARAQRRSEERQILGLEPRPPLSRSQSVPPLQASVQVKPWVDITRPQPMGGPLGCFGGEGGSSVISLKATGGLRRIATAT